MTIGGLVMSGASAAMNDSAAGDVESSRAAAMSAERDRQRLLDDEAHKINSKSQDRFGDFGGQTNAKASSLADYFTGDATGGGDAPAAPQGQAPIPSSSSNIVNQEIAKKSQLAKQFTDNQGLALGNLRAFGDTLGGVSRDQARDAGLVGQIGGFKRGSSNVLQYELEAANSAGSGKKLFGDLLGGFGKIGTSAGLSGGGIKF